jgi:hypothetical protein
MRSTEPEIGSRSSDFSAVVKGERWYIALQPQEGTVVRGLGKLTNITTQPPVTPKQSVASCDGTNCYYLEVLPPARVAAGQPEQLAELTLGTTPKRGAPDLVAVWYAYASAGCLGHDARTNGQRLPFFSHTTLPLLTAEARIDEAPPWLPIWAGASNAAIIAGRLYSSEEQFRRTSSTNTGSLSLPSRAELTYSVTGLGNPYLFVEVVLSEAAAGAARDSFVPPVNGNISFYAPDIRPTGARRPGAGVTETNGSRWPSAADFELRAKNRLRPAPAADTRRQRANIARLCVLTVFAGIPMGVFFALALGRRRRRTCMR